MVASAVAIAADTKVAAVRATADAVVINMKTAVVILNWNTEDFLRKFLPGLIRSCEKVEGAEVVVPGLLDFCLYCLYDYLMDTKLYGMSKAKYPIFKLAYKFLTKKQQDIIDIINEHGKFDPPTPFGHTVSLINGYIGIGAKMGEGWLLTAEMLELADKGVTNIVCTQPFGCLPNHICGKGMMKPIKERNPDINIVAIDYDAGATAVNQENRIKLMLSNCKSEEAAAR